MTATTYTREVIRDAIIALTPLAQKYTSTAAATTGITDSQVLKGPHPSSLIPRGSPVRFRDVSDANNAYEDTYTDAYGPAAGTITFEPDLDTVLPVATDIVEIWLPEVGAVRYVDDDIALALTLDCGQWEPLLITALPAHVTDLSRIGRVYQRLGDVTNGYYPGEDLEYDVEEVSDGYDLVLPLWILPVYAEQWANYATLATDIATTTCDLDYVTAHACRRIFQRLYDTEEKSRQSPTSAGAWVNRWSGLLKIWRAEAYAMDTKHKGGARPRIRFPQLCTSQVAI